MILSEKATPDSSASKDTAITNTDNSVVNTSNTSSSESYKSFSKSKSITSPSIASATSASSNSVKILKSYYKKDALDSVNKSLFNIDKARLSHNNNQAKQVDYNSAGSQFVINDTKLNKKSTAATATTNNKFELQITFSQNPNAKKTKPHSSPSHSTLDLDNTTNEQAESCINFLNKLVDDEKINNLIIPTSEQSSHSLSKPLKTKSLIQKLSSKLRNPDSLDQTDSNNQDFVRKSVKLFNKIRSGTNSANNSIKLKNNSEQNSVSSNSNISSKSLSLQNNKEALASSSNENLSEQDQIEMRRTQQPNQTLYRQNQNYLKPELFLLNKRIRKHLPYNSGLKNHGNTCFMNCIIQSLLHTSPLCDFFVTDQYERDIQMINYQRRFENLNSTPTSGSNAANPSSFILTKHFHRLLVSMWRNTYETAYSGELKQLIGYLNPTFAGVNQNDSHEFCVWLLDRLSQELTYKIPGLATQTASEEERAKTSPPKPVQTTTSSFIEELVTVKFKSTVVCSICNFQSSKYETDMMLSLPLPQNQLSQGSKQQQTQAQPGQSLDSQQHTKQPIRRSLYAHLILANPSSIKSITAFPSNNNTSSSSSLSQANQTGGDHYYNSMDSDGNNLSSRSKFYISDTNGYGYGLGSSNSNQSMPANEAGASGYIAPFHVKVGVNIHISNDNNFGRELANLNQNKASGNNGGSNSTVVNPDVSDLRRYIEGTYQLRQADLVFIDLNRVELKLHDNKSIKENFITPNLAPSEASGLADSMCVVELCQVPANTQTPLINIIALNVYYENANGNEVHKKCYGLPFVVLINRDCSYSDLCKKLLEAQSKYFKDRNIHKYKDLVEKFFTLSLVDSNSENQRLSSTDELPLYAECVEKALNNNSTTSKNVAIQEHIRLNLEWRSYNDISNLFNDIDYAKAEFVHRSVKYLQKHDEADSLNTNNEQINYTNSNVPKSVSQQNLSNLNNSTTNSSSITLNDCFELFTQREELTDENSWMCPKCKKQTNAYKKLCISSVPPILIIHLKRFFYKSKTSNFKLTTPVWFPVCNLDMSRYLEKKQHSNKASNADLTNDMDNESDTENDSNSYDCQDFYYESDDPNRPASKQKPYMYDLFAVCNHKGQNMANGHYTAYCKNLIDTRWYCYDDANCTPILDPSSNASSIFNNGSNAVCTENAYILFYKRRDCMRNERWWKDYVDRSLYDYDEFYTFVNNLHFIEHEQRMFQLSQQVKQLGYHRQQQQQMQVVSKENGTSKKSNGLKTLRKFLGNGRNNANNYNYDENSNENNELEASKQAELVKNARSNNFNSESEGYGSLNDTPNAYINQYDENNKPKRLIKQYANKEAGNSLNYGSSSSSSPSKNLTNSPSSKTVSSSTNTLSNLAGSISNNSLFSSQPNNNASGQENEANFIDLSEDFSKKVAINKTPESILNYPNDNEYIYSTQYPSNPESDFYVDNSSYAPPQYQNLVSKNQQFYQQQISTPPRPQPRQPVRNNFDYYPSQFNQILYQQHLVNQNGLSKQKISNTSLNGNASNGNPNNRYVNPSTIETHI